MRLDADSMRRLGAGAVEAAHQVADWLSMGIELPPEDAAAIAARLSLVLACLAEADAIAQGEEPGGEAAALAKGGLPALAKVLLDRHQQAERQQAEETTEATAP